MLRRKLLLTLGSLILLLLVAAVFAIGLLHTVLEDLVAASTTAVAGTARCAQLETAMRTIEADLGDVRRSAQPDLESLARDVAALAAQADTLDAQRLGPEAARVLPVIDTHVRTLATHVAELEASSAPDLRADHLDGALDAATSLRGEVTELSRTVRRQSLQEQERLVREFRVAGVLVGVAFLLLLNASIVVLLRAATMIIRPVDSLVEASRRLGREEFGHRVEVAGADEFAELARAYNGLAEQLQTNEQRKLEILHHVARTLNHELNNAISAIDLQLELLGRHRDGDPSLAEPLRRIQQTLGRMSRTIDSLQRVRKIVLTDYLAGVKMLDLERSVLEGPAAPGSSSGTVAETTAS